MSWLDEPRVCDLCGTAGPMSHGIVRWKTEDYDAYDAVVRCLDRNACRARAIAGGRPEWIDAVGKPDDRGKPKGFTPGHYRVFEANRQFREGFTARLG